MSLVGSLEDLNLGDILQIISLSQKSGVLALKTSGAEGRIVFVNGLVRGAAINDGPQDLEGVLLAGGFVDEAAIEAARAYAEAEACSLADAIAATGALPSERVESVCRETIESAVIRMFSWSKGDFSFDVRTEPLPGDPELLAPNGVNAQYLAMEGARLRDEGANEDSTQDGDDVSCDAGFDDMSAHELFGAAEPSDQGEPDDDATTARQQAVDVVALASIDTLELPEDPEAGGLSDKATALAAEIMALGEAVADPADTMRMGRASEPALEADATDPFVEEIALDEPLSDPQPIELLEFDGDEADTFGEPAEDVPSLDPDVDLIEVVPLEEPVDLLESAEADEPPTALDPPGGADPELMTTGELQGVGLEPDAQGPDPIEFAEPHAPVEEADAATTQPTAQPSVATEGPPRALVVVDDDLVALEWIKHALKDSFEPIHIFQQTDQALTRIRQYIVRGLPPAVLISPAVDVDRLGGVRDAVDFIGRLKTQSPRVAALWLREEGAATIGRMGEADGSVVRPDRNRLRAAAGDQLAEASADFRRQVDIGVSGAATEPEGSRASRPGISPDALRRLRDATKALTEASSRGEVLPLVIRFASEVFGRVAMFMVRDGTAVGMAQTGLPDSGGPDDAQLRELAFPCDRSAWMGLVLDQGKPVRGAPANDGDRALADMLGEGVADEAYVAPIESGGQVIALLYGDNLTSGAPIGDTSALEVVLHHAGLALDRAALERALREGNA